MRNQGPPVNGNGNGNGNGKKEVKKENKGDQALVDRCKDGDGEAWEEVHQKCHGHLIKQIRFSLGDQAADTDLVMEIEARVWFNLYTDDGHLLRRYEPKKGNGLESFLGAVARFEVLRYQRGELRRRRRERETRRNKSLALDDRRLRDLAIDLKDFAPTLTPREKEFFWGVLLGNNGVSVRISAPNAWQLRHRIRKKLLAFLDIEDSGNGNGNGSGKQKPK